MANPLKALGRLISSIFGGKKKQQPPTPPGGGTTGPTSPRDNPPSQNPPRAY